VPRILVLLAAFNGAEWIEEQIDTILRQTDAEVHIIVGDDASTDATLAVLSRYGPDRVTVLIRARSTGSAAQNFFAIIREVEADGYDFVAFSDQDDIWHTDKLSRAAKMLRHADAAGYSAATTAFWNDDKRQLLRQNAVTRESDFLFEGAGQGCTYMLSRRLYQRLREFLIEEQNLTSALHYHDWATYALVRTWRMKWFFDPQPTMLYRQHRRNDTGARNSLAAILRRIARIRNGWYRGQLIGISCLVARADPFDALIAEWCSLLAQRPGIQRRLKLARFCLRGGRRRITDRIVLIAAVLIGWI
jgi:rhamnosyltransferase